MEQTTINKEARARAMKEYFSMGELIVINEALCKYQWDCNDRAGIGNKSAETISKLRGIAAAASELREEFDPLPL
jgi:hypothetical protein